MSWKKLLNQPISLAKSYPGFMYHSEKIFQHEVEHLFPKSWYCLGSLSSLKQPGDSIVRNIGNQSVIVTRDKQGQLKAFKNTCRHRGASLIEEDGNYSFFSCPYHRWAFSLDGQLKAIPNAKQICKKNLSLFPIEIQTFGHLVFGSLDPPNNINHYFGDCSTELQNYPLDKLETVRKTTYKVNANWKLLVENFLDYYHLNAVHPDLVQVSEVDNHIHPEEEPVGNYCTFKTYPLTNAGTPIDTNVLPMFTGLNSEEQQSAIFHVLFPNVFYFLFPNHLFTVICHPINQNETIEYAELAVLPELVNDVNIDDIWNFYDKVNCEDFEICERVHRGTKGNYPGGLFVDPFERGTHRFQNMVAQYF